MMITCCRNLREIQLGAKKREEKILFQKLSKFSVPDQRVGVWFILALLLKGEK